MTFFVSGQATDLILNIEALLQFTATISALTQLGFSDRRVIQQEVYSMDCVSLPCQQKELSHNDSWLPSQPVQTSNAHHIPAIVWHIKALLQGVLKVAISFDIRTSVSVLFASFSTSDSMELHKHVYHTLLLQILEELQMLQDHWWQSCSIRLLLDHVPRPAIPL